MKLSLIRIGTMEDFLEWLYIQDNSRIQIVHEEECRDHIYESECKIFTGGDNNPQTQVLLYQAHGTSQTLTSLYEYITSKLGVHHYSVWVLIQPSTASYTDCGCRTEWCLRCEKHGGPYLELQRACAAYLHGIGGHTRSNLKMLNYAAGKYSEESHLSVMNDLCIRSFDQMMYTDPDIDRWIHYVCYNVVLDIKSISSLQWFYQWAEVEREVGRSVKKEQYDINHVVDIHEPMLQIHLD